MQNLPLCIDGDLPSMKEMIESYICNLLSFVAQFTQNIFFFPIFIDIFYSHLVELTVTTTVCLKKFGQTKASFEKNGAISCSASALKKAPDDLGSIEEDSQPRGWRSMSTVLKGKWYNFEFNFLFLEISLSVSSN